MAKHGEAEAALIRVEGSLHGVGFRSFAENAARSSKVAGYVENMKDGTVSIFAQGPQEGIQQFLDSIRKAPPPIIVDNVAVKKSRPRPKLRYFQIKTGPLGIEMQEGFGALESQFYDYRKEFRSFAERTDSNFQSMDKKCGEISSKLTEILTFLQTQNVEAIRSLNRSVELLEKAVEKLPARTESQDRTNQA